MTSRAHIWTEPLPRRGGLAAIDVGDAEVWADRLRRDSARAARHQSFELAQITATIVARAIAHGARGLVLTGSTARGRRTRVSDLDYHVIGARPPTDGLKAEVDLYCDDVQSLATKLASGDDFAHWSLWYGCVLLDDGTLQRAAASIAAQDAWPDADRKLRQAREGLGFAERLVGSGDREPATEQVRGLCTLTARWLLLAHEIFPLSRDELADQVADLGCVELAAALDRTIHCDPELDELAAGVRLVAHLTQLTPARARRARMPSVAVGDR